MTIEFPLSTFIIIASLPFVLYGCEIWYPTLREKRRLRVFEISPKRDEVTREWRKLHKEELNDMYPSSNIVRVIKPRRRRVAGHAARLRERRGVCRILVGKSEGRRPLGRTGRRWEDNIKMDLQEF